MKLHTHSYIKKEFSQKGYTLLEKEYKGAHSKLTVLCTKGHRVFLTYQKFKQGRRCKFCNQSRIYFEDIRSSFDKEGYVLLSNEKDYKSSKSKLDFICPRGHKHGISWSHWKMGSRCRYCYYT